jgi:hypothetical protein
LSGQVDDPGWAVGTVELDPDELRADDIRYIPLFAAPPTAAAADPGAGRFVEDALQVLLQGERVATGGDVLLSDRPATGATVVFPPADPAMIGAVNRSLSAAGVTLRFGERLAGEWEVEGDVGAGATVLRRHRLSGGGAVFASVAGEPWLAREDNVVLVASRMEPDWGDLPVSARFVPFLDFLVNRVAAREAWTVSATAGEMVLLPDGTVELVHTGDVIQAPGDLRLSAPLTAGVYFLRDAAGDTVGALAVNHDPRESRLQPADARLLRTTLGPEVRLVDSDRVGSELFRGIERADLTAILLLGALLAALAEFAVASSLRTGWGKA